MKIRQRPPKLPQMLLITQWYFLAIYFPWIRLHQDAWHWEMSWRQTPPPGAGGTEQLSLWVFTPSTQLMSDPSCWSWGNTAAELSGSLLFPLRQNSGFWEALHLGKSGGKGWCMACMLESLSSWLLPGHSDFSSVANQHSLIFPNTSSGLDIRSRDFPINMVDVKTLNPPHFWHSICSSYVVICMYPCYTCCLYHNYLLVLKRYTVIIMRDNHLLFSFPWFWGKNAGFVEWRESCFCPWCFLKEIKYNW